MIHLHRFFFSLPCSRQAKVNLHLWLKGGYAAETHSMPGETIKGMTSPRKLQNLTKKKRLMSFWLPCQLALGVICTLSPTPSTSRGATRNPEQRGALSCNLYQRKHKISDLSCESFTKFRSGGYRSPCNQFETVKIL